MKARQNRYEIEGNTVTMYTWRGEPFLIDKDDLSRVLQVSWCICSDGYVSGHEKGTGKNRGVRLHSFIMMAKPGEVIDHINHDKADNRKINLRICTLSENNKNLPLSKENTSGHPGVSWMESRKKWRAYISVNNKFKHLGLFGKIEDAIKARKEAEAMYYGDFSYSRSCDMANQWG